MKINEKLKGWFEVVDEDTEEQTEGKPEALSDYEKATYTNMGDIMSDANMVLFEPREFEEAATISDHLKCGRSAIVNTQRLQADAKRRMLDFLAGVIYALEGSGQKVGEEVVLFTPNTVKVGGEIAVD